MSIAAAASAWVTRSVSRQSRCLVAGRALHADGDLRGQIVPVSKFGWIVCAVDTHTARRSGRVMGDYHGRCRDGLHMPEGIQHPGLRVARPIWRPGLPCRKAAFEV